MNDKELKKTDKEYGKILTKNQKLNKKIKKEIDEGLELINKKNDMISELNDKIKKRIEKMPKRDLSFIWPICCGLLGFSTIGLLGALFIKGIQLTWITATFTFFILFLLVFGFLIYLGKKTHAILEFKAMLTGKPISLFFTDYKKVDWKVIEPEGGVISDKTYGAFLVNEKGAYIDKKTKNVFLAFNSAIATNASLECFKITDSLAKVLKDEKDLASIRHALIDGTLKGNTLEFEVDGKKEVLPEFEILRENVDFSPLKSLLNTLIPHGINSKIEMTIQQRISGLAKINPVQIILIIVGIIGATTIAIMLLKMYGDGGGATTVIRETTRIVAENASNTVRG